MTHNYYKQNSVFFWTLLIAIGVIIFGAAYSSILGEISGKFMSWVSHYFGWLYILSIVAFIGFCVWIALSKYGKINIVWEIRGLRCKDSERRVHSYSGVHRLQR